MWTLMGKLVGIRELRRLTVVFGLSSAVQGVALALMIPFLRSFLGDRRDLALWLTAVVVLGVASLVLGSYATMASYRISVYDVCDALIRRIGDHVLALPLGWFDARSEAAVASGVSREVNTISHVASIVMPTLCDAFIIPGVMAAAVVFVDWRLALIMLLAVGPMAWAWALCVGSAAAFVALRFYESRIEISGRAPLIPPSLLAISTMRRGLLVLGSGFLVFGGYLFAFALAMQEGNSMSALESGMSMAPMALGQFLSAMRAPQIIKRYGIRSIQIGGLAQATGIAAVMLPVILFWPYSEFYHVAAGMFLIGIGNGLYVPNTYRTILSTIPDHKIGLGSGLITTVQQSALAVGVAALGAVFMGISASASMGTGFLGVGTIFLAVALSYTVLGARVADRRGRTEGLGARI